jgi:hypothetical protein
MLTAACVASVAAGVVALLRWWLRRLDVLGRKRPFPLVSVALSAVLAVGCAIPVLQHHRLEGRLSAAASRIVGFDVRVHCETPGETMLEATGDLAHVSFDRNGRPERRAVVKWEQCRDLSSWLRSPRGDADPAQLIAVHVVTHEAMHMAGILDEAKAECAAVQRDQVMAQALGATAVDAATLARRYWIGVYPRMPDGYRSGECGPGGGMDERKNGAPWSQ